MSYVRVFLVSVPLLLCLTILYCSKSQTTYTNNSNAAASTSASMFGGSKPIFPPPCRMGDESIMAPKAHGTSKVPVQDNLRWGCDKATADRICNYNRHYAEHSGYFEGTTFIQEAAKTARRQQDGGSGAGGAPVIDFYDSNTGQLLFTAPKGRTMEDFLVESRAHGWPSFRDEEVNWDYVRCLPDGETVSVDGTHLGHNLPDKKGSRYCINLVSVAGRPPKN